MTETIGNQSCPAQPWQELGLSVPPEQGEAGLQVLQRHRSLMSSASIWKGLRQSQESRDDCESNQTTHILRPAVLPAITLHGFQSQPSCLYWSVETMFTLGLFLENILVTCLIVATKYLTKVTEVRKGSFWLTVLRDIAIQ